MDLQRVDPSLREGVYADVTVFNPDQADQDGDRALVVGGQRLLREPAGHGRVVGGDGRGGEDEDGE